MNCKETQRAIRPFLEGELRTQEAQEFVCHVRSCKECMEELSISYLVTEGLNLFEESGDADIKKRLEEKLDNAMKKKKMRKQLKAGVFALVAFVACALIFS